MKQRLPLPKPAPTVHVTGGTQRLAIYKMPSPQNHRRNYTERDSSLSSRLTPTNE